VGIVYFGVSMPTKRYILSDLAVLSQLGLTVIAVAVNICKRRQKL